MRESHLRIFWTFFCPVLIHFSILFTLARWRLNYGTVQTRERMRENLLHLSDTDHCIRAPSGLSCQASWSTSLHTGLIWTASTAGSANPSSLTWALRPIHMPPGQQSFYLPFPFWRQSQKKLLFIIQPFFHLERQAHPFWLAESLFRVWKEI